MARDAMSRSFPNYWDNQKFSLKQRKNNCTG